MPLPRLLPRAVFLSVVLLSGACVAPGGTSPKPVADAAPPVRYACDGPMLVTAAFGPHDLTLTLPEGPVRLGPIASASGAHYGNGAVEFWDKGSETMLITADGERRDCIAAHQISPWDAARQRGVEFRATGQEPGWMLEVDQQAMIFLELDYGSERVFFPPVDPARDTERGLITWHSRSGEQAITIIARTEMCQDIMSGEIFEQRVSVVLGDRTLTGCGRALPGFAVGER